MKRRSTPPESQAQGVNSGEFWKPTMAPNVGETRHKMQGSNYNWSRKPDSLMPCLQFSQKKVFMGTWQTFLPANHLVYTTWSYKVVQERQIRFHLDHGVAAKALSYSLWDLVQIPFKKFPPIGTTCSFTLCRYLLFLMNPPKEAFSFRLHASVFEVPKGPRPLANVHLMTQQDLIPDPNSCATCYATRARQEVNCGIGDEIQTALLLLVSAEEAWDCIQASPYMGKLEKCLRVQPGRQLATVSWSPGTYRGLELGPGW